MRLNTDKPKLNLAELAQVTAKFPAPLRRRLPLPVLQSHLYGMAIDAPNLIEEVEEVYLYEADSRAKGVQLTYSANRA